MPGGLCADLAPGSCRIGRSHCFSSPAVPQVSAPMPWFSKKIDPISDRARTLNAEIASLEAQIKSLDSRLQRQSRSTPSLEPPLSPVEPALVKSSPLQEPIFEEVGGDRLKGRVESVTTTEH